MAKPIRATPKLKGLNAEKFVKRMIYVEQSRISELDKSLALEIKKEKHLFKVA